MWSKKREFASNLNKAPCLHSYVSGSGLRKECHAKHCVKQSWPEQIKFYFKSSVGTCNPSLCHDLNYDLVSPYKANEEKASFQQSHWGISYVQRLGHIVMSGHIAHQTDSCSTHSNLSAKTHASPPRSPFLQLTLFT